MLSAQIDVPLTLFYDKMMVIIHSTDEKAMSTDLPQYSAVQQALKGADAVASTSESHGLLTGLFCSGKIAQVDADQWAISTLLDDKEKDKKAGQTLRSLYRVTQQQLDEMDFSFQLLLPDDDEELDYRAKELGAWCQGFNHGLQLGNVNFEGDYSDDCLEAFERTAEIAEIDYENVCFSQEDEAAYAEVVEYVRLAILVIYTDVAKGQGSPATPTESRSGHLH